MEATYISEKDWDLIMKPMVSIVLQRSKFSSTFPRAVFYSSGKFQGLGVMHPWHRQELSHLITLCKETMHGTPTGELLQANAEQLRLEMGLPGSFTDGQLHHAAPYLTDSWLKDLLLYLHKYEIKLDDPLPKLLPQRSGDIFLMLSFIDQGYRGQELSILNGCRQCLQVTTLADISSIDGTEIRAPAWNGKHSGTPRHGWPRKPKMTRNNWQLWQDALRPFLRSTRNLQLDKRLGEWLAPPPSEWKWFFSPSEE
jgi:hypothetical protein